MDNRITVRLPDHIRGPLTEQADKAGLKLGIYVVQVLADRAGVEVGDRLVGAAALGPEDRTRIGKAGAAGRWKSPKKRPSTKARK